MKLQHICASLLFFSVFISQNTCISNETYASARIFITKHRIITHFHFLLPIPAVLASGITKWQWQRKRQRQWWWWCLSDVELTSSSFFFFLHIHSNHFCDMPWGLLSKLQRKKKNFEEKLLKVFFSDKLLHNGVKTFHKDMFAFYIWKTKNILILHHKEFFVDIKIKGSQINNDLNIKILGNIYDDDSWFKMCTSIFAVISLKTQHFWTIPVNLI